MKPLYLLPLIFLLIIPANSVLAQKDCGIDLFKDKACHIIEIEYDTTHQIPTYKSNSMVDIPYATPIYLRVINGEHYSFKVKIDTVIAQVINPLDNVVGAPDKESLHQIKTGDDTTYIYLGAFDPGNQIRFTLLREESNETTKTTLTETTLDSSFITNTLQKGEEEHKKVNLLNLLNGDTHPNEKFWVKLDTQKGERHEMNGESIVMQKETASSEIAWKPYEEIFSIHNGNTTSTTTITEKPVRGWESIGNFSFHVPKRYRFRIRAGFNAAYIKKDVVSVQSRLANSGDIDGFEESDFHLGFRSSQFLADTTQVYRINAGASKSWEFSPVLMLSVYPVHRKSLGIDNSLVGYLTNNYEHSFLYALSQIFSLHVGTSLNEKAFKDYYGGVNLELFEGVEVSYSAVSKNVTKLNAPYEYQDFALNGSTPFFTNNAIPDADVFVSKKRTRFDSFSVTVDGVIFQNAFITILDTIKKSIVGK